MKKTILVSVMIFALMTGTMIVPLAEASSNFSEDYKSLPSNFSKDYKLLPSSTIETLPDGTIVETVYEKGDVPIPTNLIEELSYSSDEWISTASVYGSNWISAGTKNYSQKMTWTTVAAASAGLGIYLKIPHFSAAALVINWAIANKNSWIYYSDKQSFRMAGATLQIKHEVTFYKDSKRTKKLKTQTYITNDRG